MQGSSSSSSSAANVARLSTRRGGGSSAHQLDPPQEPQPDPVYNQSQDPNVDGIKTPGTPALTVSEDSEDGGAGGE